MADLRDYTKKNPIFVGTDGIRLPTGNNAQRTASSNVAGTLRFNTDINGIETYTSAGWRPLAAPPSISTVSPSTFNGESGTQFIINGEGFTPDAQVYFVTANGTPLLASSVSYYSPVQVRATTPRNITVQEEPISVRVVQQSGTITLSNCIDAGGLPTWVTTAGTLGSIFGANTVNVYVTATDPEGTAVSYQLNSGSLPNGLQLSANGLIQGLANSVLANTTYNFVIKANDTVNNNTDRSFSYTVLNRAPVINTAAGSLGTIFSGNAVPTATISAYDPDGGQLTYSIASGSLPANTGLGSANGVIQGTPVVVTTNTTYTFSVSTTDEGSLSASNTYTYTVLNRPPLWNTNPTLTSYSAETFTPITINAYDPDGAAITYTLTSGSVPTGLTFVTANATITGTAQEVDSNTTSTFTVTATDVGNDANARTFSLTITPIIDSNFANTVLLLKTAGNTIIKDASSNNLNLVVTGDSRATNFSPYNTSWSNLFDGSGDSLTLSSSPDFNLGTNNWTLEFWLYLNGSGGGNYNHFLSIDQQNTFAFKADNSVYYLYGNSGGGATTLYTGGAPVFRQWHHLALVRNGTLLTLYKDGVQYGPATSISAGATFGATSTAMIGNAAGTTNEGLNGYISNVRLIKGTALYTSNTTISTTPLANVTNTVLLTCHTNRFVNQVNTSMTLTVGGDTKVVGWSPFAETDTTSGSMYFDGTGDYLTLDGSGNVWPNSTQDFTVEFWYYRTNAWSSGGFILDSSASSGFQVWVNTGNGILRLGRSAVASVLDYAYSNLKINEWTHFAYSRSGSSFALWVNGTRVATATDSGSFATTNGTERIGAVAADGTNPILGYLADVRVVKGSFVYNPSSTTITVPTSILTNVANTKLLTLQNRQPHNNHGFQDSSNNKHLITRNGNPSQGTFSPFSADLGKWSNYFDSSYLTVPANNAFVFGTGDFTIELWVYQTAAWSINNLLNNVSAGNQSWSIGVEGGNIVFGGWNVSFLNGGTQPSLNAWHHVAVVRSGTTLSMFVDGVRTGTTTNSTDFSSNNTLLIGGFQYSSTFYYITGYLSNVRLVKGTAVYNPSLTTCTVPTAPLTAISGTSILTCQNNRFIDNSNNAFTLSVGTGTPSVQAFSPFAPNAAYTTANVGGSVYMDGTGDFLSIASNPNLAISTVDFTVEYWIYPTSFGTSRSHIMWVTVGDFLALYTNSSGNIVLDRYGASTLATTSNAPILNSWNHVVCSRVGTTLRIFINGVQGASITNSTNWATTDVQIGNNGQTAYFLGYMYGMRVLKGTGVSSVTIPTAPFTPVANTILLLNFDNAAIDDFTGKVNLETAGTVKSNNIITRFSAGSLSFDGSSSSYMRYPFTGGRNYIVGTEDFTLEFFMYLRNTTANQTKVIISGNPDGSGGNSFGLRVGQSYLGNVNGLNIFRAGNADLEYCSFTFSPNTWYHVAVCRTNNTIYFFVDGVRITTQGSGASNYSFANPSSAGIQISGSWGGSGIVESFIGNISDLRITKSARYTANFTPPTRSFPNR